MSDTQVIRLYVREINDLSDQTFELMIPDSFTLYLQAASFGWRAVELDYQGQLALFDLELDPATGLLTLYAAHQAEASYRVFSGLDADRLRLSMCQTLLDAWPAWQHELGRSEMHLLEKVRQLVYRLQDQLSQPDLLLYQVL